MCAGVPVLLDPVVIGGDDPAGLRIDQHRAHGHFTAFGGKAGFLQGDFHGPKVSFHGRNGARKGNRRQATLAQAAHTRHIGAMSTQRPHDRPLIGITLDSEEAGGYSKFPWYALRQNYADSVVRAGGLPMALPHEPALAADMVGRIDALIVTGGAFDVDPALFGARDRHETVVTKDRRTAFELAAVRHALAADKPVLGICGGHQLLNVALGGTLIQHIPDSVENALAHEQPNPRNEPGHAVAIDPDTLLSRLVGTSRLMVNSAHHQAIDAIAPEARRNAVAEDGVIEGIEHPGYRFCIGVQWHPEFEITDGDRAILAGLVEAARR